MKTVLIVLTALASGLGYSFQDPQAKKPADAAAQDPMQPGPQHAVLSKRVGTWDAVVIMTDEKGTEQRDKGTMTTRQHSAFHIVDDYQGLFMTMPFTGHGISGYCPIKKQYYQFWVDSMVASPMTLHGDYDEKKKELTLAGECVGMSGKLEKCRTVMRQQDDDHFAWAMFGTGPDGKEMQMLRIEYTRRK